MIPRMFLLLIAPFFSPPQSPPQLAFVAFPPQEATRFGEAGDVASSVDAAWQIAGQQKGARLGSSIATADVNGDGFDDLIVGSPGYDNQHRGEGRAAVYWGSANGMASSPSWLYHGGQRGAHFGAVVASAGDVNNDGYEDVLVGAPDFDDPAHSSIGGEGKGARVTGIGHDAYSTDEGRFYLFLGTITGLESTPQRVVTGIERDEHLGIALEGVGDVDMDGFDDVLAGAKNTRNDQGAVFFFGGTAAGIGPFPDWIRFGSQPGAGWGTVIGAAGDTNNDGHADILSSAPFYTGIGCGAMTMIEGSPGGPGELTVYLDETVTRFGPTLDWNQDGLMETLFLQSSTCAPSEETAYSKVFGSGTALEIETSGDAADVTAGDFNGDGWVDLVASAPGHEFETLHGRVFTHINTPGDPAIVATAFPVFDGDQPAAGWGEGMAVGDIDGDGSDDLFVAAPRYDAGEPAEGLVALFPGWTAGAALDEVPYSLTNVWASDTVVGDFDSDGYDDLLVASDGNGSLDVFYGSLTGLPATGVSLTPPDLVLSFSVFFMLSAGDVNGDGYDDVFVAVNEEHIWSHGGYLLDTSEFALYTGSASGLSIAPTQTTGTISELESGEIVGDVNGDGYDDIVIESGNTRLHLGNESGYDPVASEILSSGAFASMGRYRSILGGNLNGDAFADIVIARSNRSVDIYTGSVLGTVFEETVSLTGVISSSFPSILDLVDVDGDGREDILLENGFLHGLALLSTDAGMELSYQWWDSPGPGSWDSRLIASLDIDGDGHDDLLLDGARIHNGTPDGVSRTPAWFGDDSPFFLDRQRQAGDFDGDGNMEFVQFFNSFFFPDVKIFEVTP